MSSLILFWLFLAAIIALFLAACAVFIYGTITSHIAYKRNEKFLENGLKKIREQEKGETL